MEPSEAHEVHESGADTVIDRIMEAVALSVKQSPVLLLGFVGGVMWARAMHRKLSKERRA